MSERRGKEATAKERLGETCKRGERERDGNRESGIGKNVGDDLVGGRPELNGADWERESRRDESQRTVTREFAEVEVRIHV